jgi:putative colanic acid biosynthesis UDP-glucose lipid carrier transferase
LIQFALILAFNDLVVPVAKAAYIFAAHAIFAFLIVACRMLVFEFYKIYLKQKGRKSCIVTAGKKDILDEVVDYLAQNITTEFIKIIKVSKIDDLTNRLTKISSKYNITELYIPVSSYSEETIEEISSYCENSFIRLRLIFDWNKLGSKKINVKQLSQTTVLYIAATPLDDPYNALVKRTFDVVFSLLATLFIFSWLFPIIAIAVKLSSKGPVFFKQKRSGLNNYQFNCYKFRSMRINQDADMKQATQDDPRITKVGHFLRKTSLDELPQFINVISGNMSIIGPRPHMLKHTEIYSELIGNFMERHAIKPGITGLAQIKGYRGEIDDFSLLQNRVRFDRFYVNNWTLFFDIRIVARTFLSIFKDHR